MGGAWGANDESDYSPGGAAGDDVSYRDTTPSIAGPGGLSEDHLRFTFSTPPLLRCGGGAGGLSKVDSTLSFSGIGDDHEIAASASLLQKVFGGGGEHTEKRNMFVRNAKRKVLADNWNATSLYSLIG